MASERGGAQTGSAKWGQGLSGGGVEGVAGDGLIRSKELQKNSLVEPYWKGGPERVRVP